MKKGSLVLLLTLTVITQYIFATPVSVQTAQSIALNFYKLNANANGLNLSPSLKYTRTEANGKVDFYVFDMLPAKGFVIVAADDNVTPIIGYSTETNFNPNAEGTGLNDWMKTTEQKISNIRFLNIKADTRIINEWKSYSMGVNPASVSRSAPVTPLLTTFWNQNPYYNDLCPYNSTHQQYAVTGCVATAMAQIMKYWNYPSKGTGSYTYTCAQPYFSHNYGVQSANFGATTYNWAQMPPTISASNNAVATLMYHCGVAVAMDYGDMTEGGSGAYVLQADAGTGYPCAQRAYTTYFSYDANTIKGVRAKNYTATDWINLMKVELDAGRPIQYQGFDPGGGGHTWVCDGYDANNMLHMNWGWGGTDNGYFTITNLAASGYNFNVDEAALIGIQPMATAPVANLMANTTTSCNGTVQFYDLSNNFPTSWSWNFGDGTTSTLKSPLHTYTTNGTYTVTLTATNSKGTNTKTSTNYVTVARGTAPTANNVSNCSSSTFSIPVSTSNHVAWFDSSGNKISSANPFVTTLLTKTTTFWVEDSTIAPTYKVGAAANTIGSGGYFASNMRVMKFTVNKPSILSSVYVYASSAGNRTIQCMDSLGTVFARKTVYCPIGGSRVTLDFNLVPGGPYFMGLGDTANLYRNTTGASYPYKDANNIISITGNDGGPTATGYYYYFYDWAVKELDCISQRKPVTATVGALNASISASTSPTCAGMTNGTATVSLSGSGTYLWSNGQTSATATGLTAGTYTVTVNDGSGCSVTLSKTITSPTQVAPSATATNVTCNGSANGVISLSVSGGTGSYTYNWGGGVTSQNRTGLAPGTYTATVTDGAGCTNTVSKTISQPAVLSVSATPTNVSCNGAATGAISLAVSGGTSGYTYNWGSGITTQNRTGLAAGVYTVTTTDAAGCTSTATQVITEPTAISSSATVTDASCGTNNGAINLTVSGGNGSYTFNWGSGISSQNRSGLAAGSYTVTITDASSCTSVLTKTIAQSSSITSSATATNITCNGAANGSINLTVSGGNPTYTYNWGGGIISQNRTGLTAGTYTVTVTDASGCSSTVTKTITEPAAIIPSATATNVNCNGGTTGSITLSVTGGTSGYTYNWGVGITTQNRTGLTAGTYTVTITDASSCNTTVSKTITEPAAIVPTATATDIACNGTNTGAITLSVTGGTTGYTYNWGSGVSTQNRTGLAAGTYTATITDGSGCTATVSKTITQPAAISASATTTNVSCSGGNTGAITLLVSGGTAGYTYNWGSGITTPNRTGLSAGTYTVTITDAASCTSILSQTITQSGSLVASTTATNINCAGANNGSITLSVSGGTPTYTYNWGGGVTSQNRTGLAAGTYSVTITDLSGCSSIATKTITEPTVIVPTANASNVNCNGGSTGAITLSVTGGNPTYTYNWGAGITTQSRSNLAAGTYTVTITDASNCTSTISKTITQPSAISSSTSATNVNCFGTSTGSITLSVSGGNPTYTYNWGGGITSQNRTGLAAGTYTVTITDASGCNSTASKTITQPTAISASATTTDVACNGANTGAINVTVSGGTSGYTFNWGGGVTTQNRTGLAAGTYTVTITDAATCTSTLSKTVNQTSTLIASATSTNLNCAGANNGSITLTVSGGNPTYTYNWGSGITSKNRTGLAAGTYTVTITDASNCVSTVSKTITEPAAIVPSATVTNVACNGGSTGSINLSVSGGNANYTYNWGGGVTTKNRTNLTAGTYTVTVTDASSCTSTLSKTITQPAVLTANAFATNVSCNGGNTGAITMTSSGGTPSYTYNWGGGVTGNNRTGLVAGTYTVTITDAQGCTTTSSKTITQPAILSATATATSITCSSGNAGTINVTTTGGTANYTYNWGGGITTQNRTGLGVGTYTVTITDAMGCTATLSKSIAQINTLSTAAASTNVSCNGGNNGAINLTVSGGNPNYTYNWGAGITTQNRTGLTAGTYSVTITDASGCVTTATKTITQPTALTPSVTATNVACNGGTTGSITLAVSGGNANYSYNWGGGITTQNRTGLVAGDYTVTITDASGCTATTTKTITQPSALIPSTTSADITCNGLNNGSITLAVTGGNPNYTYNWGNGVTTANRTGLAAGSYTVTITDASGCTSTTTKTITQPTAVVTSASITNIACNAGNTGAIELDVTGGTTGYTFNWGAGITTQDRTGLAAGTYTVTVTDGAGCTSTLSSTVTQSNSISLSATATNVKCAGGNDGAITLLVSGGTPTYNYNWGAGVTSANRTGLAAGTYTVTITDAAGCSSIVSKTITQPSSGVTATSEATDVTCNGANTGTINLTVSGGTPGYTFNWGNGITTQNRTGLAAGNYTVTITDASGCTSTLSKIVAQNNTIMSTATSTAATCFGGNNGSITLSVTGGNPNYTYNWGSGITTQNRSGLSAGTYTVTITDASGCVSIVTKAVTQPAAIVATPTATNIACNGGNTGAITLAVSGGNPSYTFNWGNSIASQNRTGLVAGTYTVTVTDAAGCKTTATQTVTQATAIIPAATLTNVSCFGGNNGAISLTVSGGTPNYTYNWGAGVTAKNRTGLTAGTFTVTITDGAGCTSTVAKTISQPTAIAPVATATNVACNGGNTGAINITVSGGTPNYTYNWGNNITTANRTSLTAGSYTVTVKDAAGCQTTVSKIITQATAITATATSTNVACNGGTTGTITLTPSGGTPGYTYNWGNNISTANRTGLAAGTYTVTITDAAGCKTNFSKAITQPTPLLVSTTVNDATCNLSNGGASAIGSGGAANYTYLWSNNISSSSISNVPAGNYVVVLTDKNNCTSSATVTIGNTSSLETNVSLVNNLCSGTSKGSASITITNGAAPFSYIWSNGDTTNERKNLKAGDYKVTVTDGLHCQKVETVTLTDPSPLAVNYTSTNNICNGDNSGSVTVRVMGGKPGYSFNWTTGDTTNTVNFLTAGNYAVTITDNNSCVATTNVTITQPSPIQLTTSATGSNEQSSGEATVSHVSGAAAPYTFEWSTGDTGTTVSKLSAGTYSVTITDKNGCHQVSYVTVGRATGVEELSHSISFTAYPNPASSGITVKLNELNKETTLQFKNTLGQTLFTNTITDLQTNIDLSSFAAGIYWIEVMQGEKRIVKEIVVSR